MSLGLGSLVLFLFRNCTKQAMIHEMWCWCSLCMLISPKHSPIWLLVGRLVDLPLASCASKPQLRSRHLWDKKDSGKARPGSTRINRTTSHIGHEHKHSNKAYHTHNTYLTASSCACWLLACVAPMHVSVRSSINRRLENNNRNTDNIRNDVRRASLGSTCFSAVFLKLVGGDFVASWWRFDTWYRQGILVCDRLFKEYTHTMSVMISKL